MCVCLYYREYYVCVGDALWYRKLGMLVVDVVCRLVSTPLARYCFLYRLLYCIQYLYFYLL